MQNKNMLNTNKASKFNLISGEVLSNFQERKLIDLVKSNLGLNYGPSQAYGN